MNEKYDAMHRLMRADKAIRDKIEIIQKEIDEEEFESNRWTYLIMYKEALIYALQQINRED